MSQTNMPAALKEALDFEKKGRDFYLQTAAAATDPLSQKLFATLADDELHHAERFQAIYAAQAAAQPWPAVVPGGHRSLEPEISAWFKENRGRLKPGSTTLPGYEFAMDMEKKGIQMYIRFAAATAHAGEKKFYAALLEEEKGHLEALQNVFFFLTQSGDWYQDEESHHWNWMNV